MGNFQIPRNPGKTGHAQCVPGSFSPPTHKSLGTRLTSNTGCMGVSGETLQLHTVYKKPDYKLCKNPF